MNEYDSPRLKFERITDSAQITLKPDMSLDYESPHQIQDLFVSEGFLCVGEIKRAYYMDRHGRNYDGRGREHEETVIEPIHMLLVAEVEPDQSWIDAKKRILPQESFVLGGKHRNWRTYEDFRNLMTFDTANRICAATNAIDTAKTIESLRDDLRRLFWMDPQASSVLALWDAGTYVHDAFQAYPYLWLNGLKGTAKTSILEYLERTAYHAQMSSMMTTSALFRSVDDTHATILCDEGENLLAPGAQKDQESQKRVSLFNAGYKAGASVTLSESKGDGFKLHTFSAYSPKAIASINPIQDTLQSRSLILVMLKAMESKYSTQQVDESRCRKIREELYFLRFQEGVRLRSDAMDPDFGVSLSKQYKLKNREWEIFKPILCLAKLLTPQWLDDVKSFIEDQKIIHSIDNRMSTDAQILILLRQRAIEGENAPNDAVDTITYGDFLRFIKDQDPSLKWVHPKTLGNILRRAGLKDLLDKWGVGAVIKLERAKIEKALERMDVDFKDRKDPGDDQQTLNGGTG